MFKTIYCKPLVLCAVAAVLSGCGGGEEAMALPTIKLSGPVAAALAASDQSVPSADGTFSVGGSLSLFPHAARDDFASRFPDRVADEQYRIVNYDQGIVVSEVFGIEGEDTMDNGDVEAIYNSDGSFSASVSSSEPVEVPVAVSDILDSLYPNSSMEELEQLIHSDGMITYEVELEDAASEREVLISDAGVLLEESVELAESEVPTVVLANASQEFANSTELEFERVTDSLTGGVTYHVESEGEAESVEFVYDASGNVVSITFEQAL